MTADYFKAVLIIIAAALVAYLMEQWLLPSAGTALFLLLGVIAAALLTSIKPAYVAALVGAILFNLLFTAPRLSFHMQEVEEIATLAVFLAVALSTIHLVDTTQKQRAELADAELRSRILLSLSHDLRTPLTSIVGNLSTIQSYGAKLNPEEYNDLFEGAVAESERLASYLDNLLQVTKLEHGAVKLRLEAVDLVTLVDHTIQRCDQSDRIVRRAQLTNFQLQAHASLLGQALYNLLDNALRYSPANSPVEIELSKARTNQLIIRISNDSDIISSHNMAQWFTPFPTATKSDHAPAGVGLGLAVAAGIIKAHRGEITAESNAGTTVLEIRLAAQGDPGERG